jgi:tetratricopeptide (TPR) repeat protein
MIPACESAVQDRERIAGPEHRETLIALGRLAHAYHKAGRPDDAIPLYRKVLAAYEITTSEIDPVEIITIRNNLALALLSAGRPERVVEIFEQNLIDSESMHDEENVLIASVHLSHACEQSGDAERAISLRERSLPLAERLRDASDPLAIDIRNRLAHAYVETDMIDKAIPLLEKNLAESERALGLDDIAILIRRRNLGFVYEHAGRLGDARVIYEQNIAETERILGRDHPDYALALEYLDACEEAI